jgi:hypothetical protein
MVAQSLSLVAYHVPKLRQQADYRGLNFVLYCRTLGNCPNKYIEQFFLSIFWHERQVLANRNDRLHKRFLRNVYEVPAKSCPYFRKKRVIDLLVIRQLLRNHGGGSLLAIATIKKAHDGFYVLREFLPWPVPVHATSPSP